MPYQRKELKFGARGVVLSKPLDLLGADEFPYLKNYRQFIRGVLSPRPGMTAVSAVNFGAAVHSVTRLNKYLTSTFARFVGAGTGLYLSSSAVAIATGFSGNPLQFVTVRPEESPEPWLYVSDSSKSGKARVDGTFYNHGIAPPTVAAYAQPAATSKQIISDFEAVGAWANGGTAGAISLVTRISTTITAIVWDTGSTGWATVQPATLDEAIQPGMLLVTNGTVETVMVESVSEAVTNTTISSIQYDSGTSGPCTIQLAAPTAGLARDSMLRLNSGGAGDEYVRVLSVTPGPGGLPSFRCSTVNTQAAANTVTGLRSFRAYFVNTHAAAGTLISQNLESSITVGIGYITLTGALDLSVVNSRPVTDDDIIHISIKLDNIDLLTEGRIAFDVDRNTNDFTQNYLWKPFRANDLSPATTGAITTLAAQQRVIQRDQIDSSTGTANSDIGGTDITDLQRKLETFYISPKEERYFQSKLKASIITWIDEFGNETHPPPPGGAGPLVDQTALGASQWTELRFRVGDLQRVGSDTSRGLHDVAAIRIQLQTTGTVQLDADAWWIGGTYGANNLPDIGVGAPYNYRFVYRSSLTGALSNPSPAMRNGIDVKRQSINGTVTASSDTQVDYIDIYRTGGALITSDNSKPWFYVMSVPNSSPTFTDIYSDDVVIRNPQLDFDNYQPFLDVDVPKSGICSIVGTEVTRVSGDSFNTAWPAGTIITINNVPYTLYIQPSSTGKLSLNENAGTQSNVTWFITTPRLMAQKLPAVWGPFGGGLFEPVIFGCGSSYQPGKVFWTRSGNPDACSQFGSLELTTPSEPLIKGAIFRSQAFVFSSESFYVLQPTEVNGDLRFSGGKVAGSRGLFCRDALCVGDEGIFYLSRDGIYLTAGAESVSLTDEFLYPIFPHEGATGVTTNNFTPPDFTLPQYLRLSYSESELYFDYRDTDGNYKTLLYDIKLKGWFPYEYTPQIRIHYLEEGSGLSTILMGGNDGLLYLSGGTTDAGTAIPVAAWTQRFDGGDPRSNKQWANGILDYSGTPTVVVKAVNESETLDTLTLATNATRAQSILDFDQVIRQNLLLQISGDAPLTLYGFDWEFIQVSVSELTNQRNSYATEFVFPEEGVNWYAILGHISTADLTVSVTVDDQTTDPYTVTNSSGVFERVRLMLAARKGRRWTTVIESTAPFQIIAGQSFLYGKPWKSQTAFSPLSIFGDATSNS
jgi:hypothetical protein